MALLGSTSCIVSLRSLFLLAVALRLPLETLSVSVHVDEFVIDFEGVGNVAVCVGRSFDLDRVSVHSRDRFDGDVE